jgi:hypothetical protein
MLTVDSVNVGDDVTDAHYSPAYSNPPIHLRITRIEKRERYAGLGRRTTMCQVDEIDADGNIRPTRDQGGTYSKTGTWYAPRDLTVYDRVYERWQTNQNIVEKYRQHADRLTEAARPLGLTITSIARNPDGLRINLTYDQARLLGDILAEIGTAG